MTKRKTSRGRRTQRNAARHARTEWELVQSAYRHLGRADDAVRSAREEDAIRGMPAYSSHLAHALLLTASEHAGAAVGIYYDAIGGDNLPRHPALSDLLTDMNAIRRRILQALEQIER